MLRAQIRYAQRRADRRQRQPRDALERSRRCVTDRVRRFHDVTRGDHKAAIGYLKKGPATVRNRRGSVRPKNGDRRLVDQRRRLALRNLRALRDQR